MFSRCVGAAALIAGTCIGAGMLATPIATAPFGFYYTVILFILIWVLTCFSGLLVVEAISSMPLGTNYISMSEHILGDNWKFFVWLGFVLLLYSLLAAYITGGGELVSAISDNVFHYQLSSGLCSIIWLAAFIIFIYLGIKFSDIVNRFLVLGLIISFTVLTAEIMPYIGTVPVPLSHGQSKYLFIALPVILASFGYHIILPSLRDYLDGNIKKLRYVVVIGTLIPVILYLSWQYCVITILPMWGKNSLLSLLASGHSAVILIQNLYKVTRSGFVGIFARFFVFFAIASSFIGVSLGLFDLLADGMKIRKTYFGRVQLVVLTFFPPLLYSLLYPDGFILALSYAGVFVAFLHGILPIVIVYVGRYRLNWKVTYKVKCGKFILFFAGLLFAVVILSQLGVNMHLLPNIIYNHT